MLSLQLPNFLSTLSIFLSGKQVLPATSPSPSLTTTPTHSPTMSSPSPNTSTTRTLSTLITASHILHHHTLLDSMGHISVRNPSDPSTFYIPLQMGPAVISSARDIGLYSVSDGSPVDENAENNNGFVERFIHSEVLRRYPGAMSVVHSHSEDVLPFTILSPSPSNGDTDTDTTAGEEAQTLMQPTYHMAGFLGSSIPNFDIATVYSETDKRDLLVNTPRLGAALASTFGTNTTHPDLPLHTTILQRGHGFVVAATSVEQAVMYAYYTASNARVLTKTLLLSGALGNNGGGVEYLNEQERKDCKAMNDWIAFKPWKQWVREVDPKRNSLYENELGSPPGA